MQPTRARANHAPGVARQQLIRAPATGRYSRSLRVRRSSDIRGFRIWNGTVADLTGCQYGKTVICRERPTAPMMRRRPS
jgi:hypothetical protein